MKKLPEDLKHTEKLMMTGVRAYLLQKVRELEQRHALATELIGEACVAAIRSNPAVAAVMDKHIGFGTLEEARINKLKKRLQIEELTFPALLKLLEIEMTPVSSAASEGAARPQPQQQAVTVAQSPGQATTSGGVRGPQRATSTDRHVWKLIHVAGPGARYALPGVLLAAHIQDMGVCSP